VTKPFPKLTEKDAFKWDEQTQAAFEEQKSRVTSASVLALPNFEEELVVESDALGLGIGIIVTQNKHPIAFFSKALGVRNLRKLAYKELMDIALAINPCIHACWARNF